MSIASIQSFDPRKLVFHPVEKNKKVRPFRCDLRARYPRHRSV